MTLKSVLVPQIKFKPPTKLRYIQQDCGVGGSWWVVGGGGA